MSNLTKNERIERTRLREISLVRSLTPEQAARLKDLSQRDRAPRSGVGEGAHQDTSAQDGNKL
jgi:hypothetical protein